MNRARGGVETELSKLDKGKFWRDARKLERVRQAKSFPEAQRLIVEYVNGYCGLLVPDNGLEDRTYVDTEYERFRSRITAASRALDRYTHEILPDDVLQRLGLTNEVDGPTDPGQVIDLMITNPDQRTRFELRRLLHFGALFYQFEKIFGREADLQQNLHEMALFLNATIFHNGKITDVDLFHKVRDAGGDFITPSGIRLPDFDGSSKGRLSGENRVHLSVREFTPLDNPSATPMHVVMQQRLKDPFSAALKAIRKGLPLQEIQDVYGFTFFVDQSHDGDQLQELVKILEHFFAVDPNDRTIHPLRTDEAASSFTDLNEHSGKNFAMEKFFADWNPNTLQQHRTSMNQVLGTFYSAPYNIDRFWQEVNKPHKPMRIEMQVGTMLDLLLNKLSGGDENHRVYKHQQASGRMREDARNVMGLLYPTKLYGLDFGDPTIIEVMRRKQLAGIGLHASVLAQLDRAAAAN